MLVESESVLGNQQGDVGLFGDIALGAAIPDFETRRQREGEEIVGATARGIDPWCRVGLLPPVVVLTSVRQRERSSAAKRAWSGWVTSRSDEPSSTTIMYRADYPS
jgi:hypothetical protein